MKRISIRSFQLKASKYLEELPLILTRYGKPIAIIDVYTKVGADNLSSSFNPVPKPEKKK